MSVLVVEDEVVIAMCLEGLLDDMGYHSVIIAHRVDVALDAARRADLVFAILDHRLFGESTRSVARALRIRGIPFIMSTGAERDELPRESRAGPILFKPYGVAELQAAIDAVTHRKAG